MSVRKVNVAAHAIAKKAQQYDNANTSRADVLHSAHGQLHQRCVVWTYLDDLGVVMAERIGPGAFPAGKPTCKLLPDTQVRQRTRGGLAETRNLMDTFTRLALCNRDGGGTRQAALRRCARR